MKVKLIKGRSYSAKGVNVTAGSPIFETDDGNLAKRLIASGHFEAVAEPANGNSGEIKEKPVDKMTEAELDAYAKEKGIDLTGLSKKADKLAKIQEAMKPPGNNNPPGDNGENGGGEIDMTGGA